jgi:hypothetical protein
MSSRQPRPARKRRTVPGSCCRRTANWDGRAPPRAAGVLNRPKAWRWRSAAGFARVERPARSQVVRRMESSGRLRLDAKESPFVGTWSSRRLSLNVGSSRRGGPSRACRVRHCRAGTGAGAAVRLTPLRAPSDRRARAGRSSARSTLCANKAQKVERGPRGPERRAGDAPERLPPMTPAAAQGVRCSQTAVPGLVSDREADERTQAHRRHCQRRRWSGLGVRSRPCSWVYRCAVCPLHCSIPTSRSG